MRVVTKQELALRVGLQYHQIQRLLQDRNITATVRIPCSGGYGFTVQQAATLIKDITGEDPRDFR